MAAVTKTFSQTHLEPVRVPVVLIFLPRLDLIISGLTIIAGLLLPLLMTIGVISASLWLVFLSFGLIAVGGALFTIFLGEIR